MMGSSGSTAEYTGDPFSRMRVQTALCFCLHRGHSSPAQLSPSRGSRMWHCSMDPAAFHSQQRCPSGLPNISIFCICLQPISTSVAGQEENEDLVLPVHDAQTVIVPSKDLSKDFRTGKEKLNVQSYAQCCSLG